MKIEGRARKLTIYIGESDHVGHRPLYQVLVERFREKGMAGVTVTRGIEGYGKRSRIHKASILGLSEDLPIVITLIDRAERIEGIMEMIEESVTEGLVTLEDVEVIHYRIEDD